jgi:hypothetical protein
MFLKSSFLLLALTGPVWGQVQTPVSTALSGPWESHTEGPFWSFEPPPSYLCNYTGNLKIIPIPADKIEQECLNLPGVSPLVASTGFMACTHIAEPKREWCTIRVPEGLPLNSTMFRHELAHCCGWPSFHPPK